MSCIGSVISESSSITTIAADQQRSLLQTCMYMREYLGLGVYKKTEHVTVDPHVKISSKTLKECYVLPAEGNHIESLFVKLSELMQRMKVENTRPPRTDFTCLSRTRHDKVFVDVDCLLCKRGVIATGSRHFSVTKSLNAIVFTVGRMFNETLTESVYMTTGGRKCGYHLFFNSLAYGINGVTEAALMDALDTALREMNLKKNVAIDRGCTQMPLPTAVHHNQSQNTVPYVLIRNGNEWKKERTNWVGMDAETLKCFSSIAFPERYRMKILGNIIVPPPPPPPPQPPPLPSRPPGNQISPDTRNNLEEKEEEEEEVTESGKRKRRMSTGQVDFDFGIIKTDLPVTKKKCLSEITAAAITSENTRPYDWWTETATTGGGFFSAIDTRPAGSDAGVVGAAVDTAATVKETSQRSRQDLYTPDAPEHTVEQHQEPPTTWLREDDDCTSVFSAFTESTDVAASFVCPRTGSFVGAAAHGPAVIDENKTDAMHMPPPPQSKKEKQPPPPPPPPPPVVLKRKRQEEKNTKTRQTTRDNDESALEALTNVIECLPYSCENDRTSAFADKQYKASLLCAEETEADATKARLDYENRKYKTHRQRVYVIPGSGSNVSREYKLLVQLVNVKRSVYRGDLATRREWTDLQISYYDQHLRNPVLLEMFKFMFGEKLVTTLFGKYELEQIHKSIVHLMTPFKRLHTGKKAASSSSSSSSLFTDQVDNEERFERDARPHKSRLIGALIRVCTHLFGMITAVVSDLRKVQQADERKDLTLLNCTVVNERRHEYSDKSTPPPRVYSSTLPMDDDDEEDEYLDCSASMYGGGGDSSAVFDTTTNKRETKSATNYTLLASLIIHEQKNLSDQALYALLYYYHYFPSIAIDRILDEVHHDGLMVTAWIRHFLMYDHHGKTLTLQEIFEGFNDPVIALSGPERFITMRRKTITKRSDSKSDTNKRNNNNNTAGCSGSVRKQKTSRGRVDFNEDTSNSGTGGNNNNNNSGVSDTFKCNVTREEIEKLIGGAERRRRRKMCNSNVIRTDNRGSNNNDDDDDEQHRVVYDWKDKHLWQVVINYYLRPVAMHEDKLVFANDSYDTFEDDAVESCAAHLMVKSKITKADVMTAFKDARTVWRMHHGSQLLYESDLRSDTIGCCFHINIALKMYEMFCGGCVTRMKRVHKNYLIDRTRFNMSVYDVVAECRTAMESLTSAIDRSYINLLLSQPVVPPFLEEMEMRQLFMSNAEIQRGSFCCLSIMDYIRAMNLFDRRRCLSRQDLDTCDYVEKFLDDLYTNEVAAERPPNNAANAKTRLLYVFYSLYMYEVLFNLRHAYARRENCYVSIQRLCHELDVRELLVLFFGESSMKRVDGLNKELEHRIRETANACSSDSSHHHHHNNNTYYTTSSNGRADTGRPATSANGRFDVRPILSVEIPDKMLRMKTLFGQFGFDVMRDSSAIGANKTTTTTTTTVRQKEINGEEYNTNEEENSQDTVESGASGESQTRKKNWDDENKFEQEFYMSGDWTETVYERINDRKITGGIAKQTPPITTTTGGIIGNGHAYVFVRETVRTVMRLELKRHIDHDRLGRVADFLSNKNTDGRRRNEILAAMKRLPMRVKLLALILTTHTVKSKTKILAADFVEATYRNADGRFADEHRVYEGEVNTTENGLENSERECASPPEKVWCSTTESLLDDRRSLLLHCRWLAKQRFECNFFIGLNPVQMYSELYEYMKANEDRYPAFKKYNDSADTRPATLNLCTAMMYILIMSAYDQEHVQLYLKLFLAVEWPGQWAKTIFVWKSNSNAGKSYLFDSIIKRACANSTCINDPKGGKENAPEKAEYVRNFVLFANEFSQANSSELKKLVSESTFKFRMNYGNVMNEAYATGKIMFNCNTLPPTSDEAAINRLTLFSIPFWFCARQKISDAMLNWTRGLSVTDATRWEMAYRFELPSLLTEEERGFFESHNDTKNEPDLFDGYAALRPGTFSTEFSRATSSMFLVQNKTSRLYASSSPPTDRIVHGLVNITNHFSWLRYFKRLDSPVDFSTLPASSEAVRSEWLSLTLPYQEWKQLTGARTDPSGRVPAESVNKSLQAFATKKNINYFGIRQFFETDFAASREAINDEYYMWFDSKAVCD